MKNSWVYSLRNVRKDYGGNTVLNIAELNIKTGELFTVVGPSGAGKSTLLRILNFLESPSAGGVQYYNELQKLPIPIDTRRNIGMLFQRPELLATSVRENVAYPLSLRSIKDDARVDHALEKLALKSMSESNAANLSGGELQRVALAMVLVFNPKVLLLDEPTANLDPYHVDLIEKIVLQLHDRGTTIVLVTHNIFQARRLADRIGLMLNGEFAEISTTEKFFENPDDMRAVDFANGKMVY